MRGQTEQKERIHDIVLLMSSDKTLKTKQAFTKLCSQSLIA